MAEPHAAKSIQPALELVAEKHPMDALRLPDGASHPSKDLSRTEPPVLAVLVRPVLLIIVIVHPLLVNSLRLLPGFGFRPVVVGEPSLNVELAFYQVLPTLTALDLPLLDAQRLVDTLGLVGFDYIGWFPFSRLNMCTEQE